MFQDCSILKALRKPLERFLKDLQHKGSETRNAGKRGGIAQLGEHLLCKQGVKGSNPFISTIRLIAQLVRALG